MVSYKKVGGLRFFRLGRLGFSFFVSKKTTRPPAVRNDRYDRACRRAWNLARLRGDVPHEFVSPYSTKRTLERDCLLAVERALSL